MRTLLLLLAVAGYGSVPLQVAFSVERLANGNTLIADGGPQLNASKVIEVDSMGRLVWAYVKRDVPLLHSARRLADGNTLMAASLGDRVVEVDRRGDQVWEYAQGLSYPNEAFRLPGGNTLITDRDNNRVIEVTSSGQSVWSYSDLSGPHNGNRLANGNTLICDSERSRVVEIAPDGTLVRKWTAELEWPRSAQRLANGNTLIAESNRNIIVEEDTAGNVVWTFVVPPAPTQPYMAVRLANGNTLVSAVRWVIEADSAGTLVWGYPPLKPTAVETTWTVNPGSGSRLYVHIHRPAWAGPNRQVPGVVLVPDTNSPGTAFDESGLADNIATDGFAVLHFDADGRGQSEGQEDYDGTVHQDGLAACVAELLSRDFVDTSNTGIYSKGYGIAMAAGMLARHAECRAKFLMDFEGPSDRYQVCKDSGGFVPVSPDSESFWPEREAANTIRSIRCAYLRMQTEFDHTRRIPDNHHCVALIDSATSTGHGGAGQASWTRVNDSVMNPENQTYTVMQPPDFIPDIQEVHLVCREVLYLHELADPGFTGIASSSSFIPHPSSLSVSPNPCRGRAVIRCRFPEPGNASLVVRDVTGRMVRTLLTGHQQPGEHLVTWDGRDGLGRLVPSGVYLYRFEADSYTSTSKLVVQH